MGRTLAGIAVIAALIGPAAAIAAEPPSLNGKAFVLSSEAGARKPNVAVDDNGTGHFVWNVDQPYPATDPAVYCRIPRGATACDRTQRFDLPLEAFGEPQVLTPAPGVVILLVFRGFGKGEGLYAIISTDGGTTFAAPKVIADDVEPGQAAYGPGEGAVSVANDVVGSVRYQAAPLDGYTEENAQVGEGGNSRGYDGTIGFPNATTPLVAFDDLTTGFFRIWGGSGNVNDLSTWKPTQTIGPVTDLRIATGIKGVVLMGKEDISLGAHKYTARRFDTTTETFGAPVDLSNPKVETDVIFRDIVEDGGGNVHAAFIANGVYGNGKHEDPMRYRASTDGGKTWGPEKTLLNSTSDTGFNLQMGAAPDGGGWVAFDGNDSPPLKAVAIPTLSQSGAGSPGSGGSLPCQGTVSFGNVQAIATSGCLQKQSNGHYTTHDPVRLNGVDLVPHTSRRGVAHAAANGEIDIDPVNKKVHIDAADVKAGPIVLDKGSFDWNVASGAPQITTFAHLEKFKVDVFGFPVVGEATLKFDKDGAFIPVHLELPKTFGGVTGDVTLRLKNPGGLKLDGFHITVGDVFLGALEVKDLDVLYTGSQPPVFEGKARFLLPPTFSEPGIKVGFGFVAGKFKHAEGSYPLQIALFPPWLYLQQIGLALSVDPLVIGGGVQLSGGPQILGKQAVTIDALPPPLGSGGFQASLGDPAVFSLAGSMEVVGLPFAKASLSYSTDGLVKFGGGIDFTVPGGLASVTAGIPSGPPLGPGFLDLTDGRFNLPLDGDTCIPAGCHVIDVGTQGVVSTDGWAVCGDYGISKAKVSVGVGMHWGDGFDVIGDFGGCDVSDYATTARHLSARAAAAGVTVDVPAGLPQENIVVTGTGGAPKITVTAPGGETLSSTDGGVAKSDHMAIVSLPQGNRTIVFVGDPPAGAYTIAAQPGSPAIAAVKHANGLPAPSVTAKVGGKGYARTLTYKVAAITGQKVRFLERGGKAAGTLGLAKGTKGTLKFTPTDGPAGKRDIVAEVSQNGIPRENIVVASYTAPGARKPGRPAFVRAKRAGTRLKVRWGRAARAGRYVVRIRLKDGTSRLYTTTKRTLTIPGVSAKTFGSVSVAGLSTTSGTVGPARKAGVKKKAKKKHRHHR